MASKEKAKTTLEDQVKLLKNFDSDTTKKKKKKGRYDVPKQLHPHHHLRMLVEIIITNDHVEVGPSFIIRK